MGEVVNWAWSKDLLKVVLFVIGQNNSHEPQLVLRWGRLLGKAKYRIGTFVHMKILFAFSLTAIHKHSHRPLFDRSSSFRN